MSEPVEFLVERHWVQLAAETGGTIRVRLDDTGRMAIAAIVYRQADGSWLTSEEADELPF